MKEFVESNVVANPAGALLIQGTFRAFTFPRHMHESYSIGLVHQGTNYFECNGTNWAAHAGNICVMNPEQIHSGKADDRGWTYTNMFLEPATLHAAVGSAHASPIWFKQHVFDDAATARHLTALVQTSLSGGDSMAAECEYALLLARLGQVASRSLHHEKASSKTGAILRVRDMLDSVCHRSVTLAELALACDMNTFHLVHRFTKEVGISPYAYHMNRRLQHAQRLLEGGSFVAEVAFSTGFTDQAHFTRHFRRFLGITPGRVARSVKYKGQCI